MLKNAFVLLCAFAITFNLTGCGGELKGEKEMKKMIDAMKEVSETKDPAKAFEALPKIMAAQAELEKLNLTPEEKKKLTDKYQGELDKYKK